MAARLFGTVEYLVSNGRGDVNLRFSTKSKEDCRPYCSRSSNHLLQTPRAAVGAVTVITVAERFVPP